VCTAPDIVGSVFESGTATIDPDVTYILTGYTVQCEGIVTTWEFCYQILNVQSVTFYPGIWENIGGTNNYSLIQSNTVTFTPNGPNSFSCQNYTLPETEQFTAPSGSVVGLYSNINVLLLHTMADNNIITYQFIGNQTSVTMAGKDEDVQYNIAIRANIGKTFLNEVNIFLHACKLMHSLMLCWFTTLHCKIDGMTLV